MIRIEGTHNTAVCYCVELEKAAAGQIRAVCDQEAFAGSKIRVMPDVHAGLGCTIGTTMTITDKVVPGMVGVDIGCGMETARIAETELDFNRLDRLIRNEIPSGREIRKTEHELASRIPLADLACARHVNLERARRSIGTLGGGNHFMEVDKDEKGALYLVVHSGSRHIGNEVARYYQEEGFRALCGNARFQIDETIKGMKEQGRSKEINKKLKQLRKQRAQMTSVPKDLAYVEGRLFDEYIHDMRIIQHFAAMNRKAMMDGSLICIGKGNEEWNFSAPHGAGRIMSRKTAADSLSLEQYKKEMEGIFTTCVNRHTLDEAPMAYKSMDEIAGQIEPTVAIISRIRPLYNYKASE